MTAHCRLSAASAPRSLSCTPSILGELYTRANDAPGMNADWLFSQSIADLKNEKKVTDTKGAGFRLNLVFF